LNQCQSFRQHISKAEVGKRLWCLQSGLCSGASLVDLFSKAAFEPDSLQPDLSLNQIIGLL
jgi:hypothetical protein